MIPAKKQRSPWLALAGLFLFQSFAAATENLEDSLPDDVFSILTDRHTTSQDVEKVSVVMRYRNHRRDLFFPYQEETKDAWDIGFMTRADFGDSQLIEYFVLGGYFMVSHNQPKKRIQLDAYAGFRNFSNKTSGDRKFAPAGWLDFFWISSKYFKLHSKLSHDFAFDRFYQPGIILRNVKRTSLENKIDLQTSKNFRVPIEFELGLLSENSNFHTKADFSLLYGVNTGWPWIWVGLSGRYEAFSQQVADYYSPTSFLSVGPMVELAFTITEDLHASVDMSGNLHRENPFARSRKGYDFSFELQYGDREDLNASLKVSRTHTSQLNSKYVDDSIGLLIATPL